MTWNVNFSIKDGQVDADTIKVAGTPPEASVMIGGWTSDTSQSLSMNVNGANVAATYPLRAKE